MLVRLLAPVLILYGRLAIALGNLHVVSKMDDGAHPRAALFLGGRRAYWTAGDIRYALAANGVDGVEVTSVLQMGEEEWLLHAQACVQEAGRGHILADIAGNRRVSVLQARIAAEARGTSYQRQHYLTILNAAHRRALTRLVFSEHPFAVERLRRVSRGRKVIREWRRCRWCGIAVDDEVHVLLACTAHAPLVIIRDDFWEHARRLGGWNSRVRDGGWTLDTLVGLLLSGPVAGVLARFV